MKYAWIAAHRDRVTVARMCRQLDVSRTGYCQWDARDESDRSKANTVLDARVAALHAESDRSYGRPRGVPSLVLVAEPSLVWMRVRTLPRLEDQVTLSHTM